ncbi:hypothetical protein E3Q19_04356 [Wallemia mellicola]|nr:hypothetical protein E3Q19_04356 [Wallemia mellicola]TIC06784.1 hypothetical protein E3Q15_04355 [Wallemia mellicola]TIC47463.1 hypothetical protein E3Q05_04425 [Wallemia mellicola]TIC72104.1 hypothetical protein E3Q00_04348 [Wallemia mellicola]
MGIVSGYKGIVKQTGSQAVQFHYSNASGVVNNITRKDGDDDLVLTINTAQLNDYTGPPVADQDLDYVDAETGKLIISKDDHGTHAKSQKTRNFEWPLSADATAIAFGPVVIDMAKWFFTHANGWFTSCATETLTYAAEDTGATLYLINGGGCTTTATRDTIHDGLMDAVLYFSKKK